MKKNLTKLLAVSGIGLLLLSACKKDGTLVKANSGTAGTLTASTNSLILDKTKYDSTTNVINFSFTWANPTSVVLGANTLSQGYATADFNSMLLKLNLPAGVASQVNVRIVHSISPTITPVYSNVLSLTVTPFNLISYVYVPGTYQSTVTASQWIPATADSLVSPTDNGVYTGYVYFQGGDNFKITPAPNWNTSYGDAGSGAISTSGGNLSSPGKGLYLVTVDLNKNTIAYAIEDHTWSLIGTAAVDWNTDIQMPFVQNSNVYQTTYALNSAGQFKFRADDAWTLSLGDVSPVDGQLTSNNGANVNVPSNGNYVISLSWGNPLLAPTYTLVKQ
jgi:hypothetical protein